MNYDGTAYRSADYRAHPNRVWQKIRRKDEPWGYKAGIDINWPM